MKTTTRSRDGYELTFSSTRDEVLVKITRNGAEVLNWAYPKLPGRGRTLEAQADFWLDQAILEAKSSEKKI